MDINLGKTNQANINDLYRYVENNSFLIVGSPLQVGFTTHMANYIAYKLFFNEQYSVLYLTKSRRDKINVAWKIKKSFEYYEYPLKQEINQGKHILYLDGISGSGVCVTNYDELNLDTVDDMHDIIVIDDDDYSDYLYNSLPGLNHFSNKLILNTRDVPQSAFYNMVGEKVVLTSKYSAENIQKNYGGKPNVINYDRILLGEFKD